MQKVIMPVIYAVVLISVLVFAAFNQEPEPPPLLRSGAMTLPEDYKNVFVQYMTVDRIDNTVRKLYIHPEALEQVRRGQDLPDGTQLIIEAFSAQLDENGEAIRDSNGRFIPDEMIANVHVSEKRSTWRREDLATTGTDVQWNFGSFTVDGAMTDENRNDCFTCHDANAFRRDFAISRQMIDLFIETGGRERYLFCPREGRASCI